MSRTNDEKKAINLLRQAAECWPGNLWLFSGAGRLHVMRKVDGKRAMTADGGVDDSYIVTTIDIENDGGDW